MNADTGPKFRTVDQLTGQIQALDAQNSHLHDQIPSWLKLISELRSENQRLQHELEQAAKDCDYYRDCNQELEIRVQELTDELNTKSGRRS